MARASRRPGQRRRRVGGYGFDTELNEAVAETRVIGPK
jgi:hypothetical protein